MDATITYDEVTALVGINVGYRTNNFTLPVRKIFAIIFGNVFFSTGNVVFSRVTILANLHY